MARSVRKSSTANLGVYDYAANGQWVRPSASANNNPRNNNTVSVQSGGSRQLVGNTASARERWLMTKGEVPRRVSKNKGGGSASAEGVGCKAFIPPPECFFWGGGGVGWGTVKKKKCTVTVKKKRTGQHMRMQQQQPSFVHGGGFQCGLQLGVHGVFADPECFFIGVTTGVGAARMPVLPVAVVVMIASALLCKRWKIGPPKEHQGPIQGGENGTMLGWARFADYSNSLFIVSVICDRL